MTARRVAVAIASWGITIALAWGAAVLDGIVAPLLSVLAALVPLAWGVWEPHQAHRVV